MDLLVIQVIFQSIAATAVTVGVIYASRQFRHWRSTAHVANFTKLVELQMQLRRMRVENPSLAEVYRHDVRHLESERDIREYFFNLMQLSVFEIVWFSYRSGQLPEDYFQSWERRMLDIATEPSFRAMMGNTSMKILHDDFQTYVLGLVAKAGPLPSAAP